MENHAFLITGFNNWGKSTTIFELFNRQRFYHGWTYPIAGVNAEFTVESHSNDDVGEESYLASIARRMEPDYNRNSNLFSALCPTRDEYNDSARILSSPAFSVFRVIHLLLLKYKWDMHAELRIDAVRNYLGGNPRIRFVVIAESSDASHAVRNQERTGQVRNYLANQFQ